MMSLTLLYTKTLTPTMLHGEIGEQLCLQCLHCALILNSHYKNTVVPRCKQGVYVSFAPENWLIWCWKCGMIGKRSPKKPPMPGVEWGPLFCWEIILSILSVRKSPGILPLLSLPAHRLYRDCQTQEPLWACARARIYRDVSDVLHLFAGG